MFDSANIREMMDIIKTIKGKQQEKPDAELYDEINKINELIADELDKKKL